jgi:hypothetical protein
MDVKKIIHNYFSHIGKKGGSSKSPKKIEALKKNGSKPKLNWICKNCKTKNKKEFLACSVCRKIKK